MKNRVYDSRDIFNFGVEKNIYGIAIFFYGLQFAEDGEGFGIRFGHFGKYQTGGVDIYAYPHFRKEVPRKVGKTGSSGIIGSIFHIPQGDVLKRNRNKTMNSYMRSDKSLKLYYDNGPDSYCISPIEISIGLHYGFRIGFNSHEFIDFIGGFFGYDPLEDDELPDGRITWEVTQEMERKKKESKGKKKEAIEPKDVELKRLILDFFWWEFDNRF